MTSSRIRSFSEPDEVVELPRTRIALVELGDLTVARVAYDPGWSWRTHVQPTVGGEWCQARHVGVILTGRFRIVMSDGTVMEVGPDDAYEIPPGHEGWVVGDEAVTTVEWSGVRTFSGSLGMRRAVATLLFTDLVGSTEHIQRLGDLGWRDALSRHYETLRSLLERHRGREVETTGDGLLASFESPAHALLCAVDARAAAATDGMEIRAGVHVGEVEMVGTETRGAAVHQAARIMSAAGAGEILVSDITRLLAGGLDFEDRGVFALKGFPGEWRLHAFLG